jgi:hypothetical protein
MANHKKHRTTKHLLMMLIGCSLAVAFGAMMLCHLMHFGMHKIDEKVEVDLEHRHEQERRFCFRKRSAYICFSARAIRAASESPIPWTRLRRDRSAVLSWLLADNGYRAKGCGGDLL